VSADLSVLYTKHIAALLSRVEHALNGTTFEHLVIASGVERWLFLDDRPYPFHANPHFKAWVPLTRNPYCWISITPGQKPILIYYQADDYWHVPPSDPEGYWVEHFDIRVITQPHQARQHLPKDLSRAAILGEADVSFDDLKPNNPEILLHRLHLARTRKSDYEIACMRQASLQAVKGQRAAATAFREHRSEYEIHLAYCLAAGQNELELPYGNIVALNEHGSTLHYQFQERTTPSKHYSLLLDAGAQVHGYAADITRTYGNGDTQFSALLESVNRVQMKLVDQARIGQSYPALHLEAHRALAQVLFEQDIVRMSADSMVESGVSSTFFPHGLGHYLGLQVHDVAGFLKDDSGATIPKPEGHPYLRLTRTLELNNVLTIEPGIYFIDSLLNQLRNSPHKSSINWNAIEHLKHFGGIRIEDNIRITEDKPENLTRDAFRQLAHDNTDTV
jgi:Xaa-Pro dipeptidase